MKTKGTAVLIGIVVICLALITGLAVAEEKLTVKGKIKDFDTAKKTLVITADDGKDITFSVEHDGAMKKLGSRLENGDEVKIKYFHDKGRNVIKGYNDLKGTKPGC